MKRLLLCLSALVLFGSLASAQNQNGQGQNGQGQNGKKQSSLRETGAVGMLTLSAGAIAGGLAIKRRKKDSAA